MTYKNQEAEISKLLSYVLESDASDLHLLVGKPPIVRVDSKLLPVTSHGVLNADSLADLVMVMLSAPQKKQLEDRRQIDFSYPFKDNTRFRVNIYYQKGTLSASLRHIPAKIRTLSELNLPGSLSDFLNYKQGLVLFVGPTGHGKSTTLAALIDQINHTKAEHIITIEDPIEYLFTQDKSIISQREVYQDTEDFPSAIRATLREDVNIVMVGEMRDLDSIGTTITVAETGHLVFATLHTNDAAQTIDRVVDVFPSHQQNQIRTQLADLLIGIVSQRLIPRIGGGRVAALEIMIANNAVRNVIREGQGYKIGNVIDTSSEQGMISLDKSLAGLVRKGLIKLEDGLLYSKNKELFKSLVRRF